MPARRSQTAAGSADRRSGVSPAARRPRRAAVIAAGDQPGGRRRTVPNSSVRPRSRSSARIRGKNSSRILAVKGPLAQAARAASSALSQLSADRPPATPVASGTAAAPPGAWACRYPACARAVARTGIRTAAPLRSANKSGARALIANQIVVGEIRRRRRRHCARRYNRPARRGALAQRAIGPLEQAGR